VFVVVVERIEVLAVDVLAIIHPGSLVEEPELVERAQGLPGLHPKPAYSKCRAAA